ncbi:metallophosphoesterase [Jiella marina]|uniref:metallophosphoesterase n=1 Tax=Jiella sp. LLJ827 TaxID=2917712 RepID=UPI0021013F5B|nr:metallophosphoesterase [Jiella sp. LLJ827]MCQ0987296.1 metallophosphoesterase [Jiella sp. LLJ827]
MEAKPNQIVAIGDVHGESGLLQRFLDGLDRLTASQDEKPAIFLLGDLVDRGDDSCGAMEIAASILAERPGSKLLLGNHDEWFLAFLDDEMSLEETFNWLDQGGAETLVSYGHSLGDDLDDIRQSIRRQWPHHLRMLKEASAIELHGNYAFVHAGVDPARPLTDQRPHDCVWIRGPFMNHVGHLSHVVLHGHTPQKGGLPAVTENRISLDTGAVFTGCLSAAWIDRAKGTIRYLQVSHDQAIHMVKPVRVDRGLGTVAEGSDG